MTVKYCYDCKQDRDHYANCDKKRWICFKCRAEYNPMGYNEVRKYCILKENQSFGKKKSRSKMLKRSKRSKMLKRSKRSKRVAKKSASKK
jgi:hypothetical protein